MDRTPPGVVDHLPESGSTGVPLDAEITVTFSETMDRASVADALFLSPLAGGDPRMSWKGHSLKIRLEEDLQQNTTYVITLGIRCKDLHNNKMSKSYSFAFATGDKIDQGAIEGQVYRGLAPQTGVGLWAYRLSSAIQPDPALDPPDYVTQTDADGRFAFQHLGQGRYRLFAVDDLNDDRKFDPADELLAVPAADLALSAGQLSAEMCPFRLTALDTTGPSLVRIEAPHAGEVDLFFDQELDSALAVAPEHYRIFARGDTGASLRFSAVSLHAGDRDRLTLSTEPQREGAWYTLTIAGLRDDAGNLIFPDASGGDFSGSGQRDETGPELLNLWPDDSTRGVSPGAEITLSFDEAVQPASVETSFVLTDSAGGSVSGLFHWAHGAELSFVPRDHLTYGRSYLLSLSTPGVLDLAGNSMGDSLLTSVFYTMDGDAPGIISGKILRRGESDSARAFVRAIRLKGPSRDNQLVTEAGEYLLRDLLPGRYRLSAFLDVDGNGRFSFGRPVPFIPAEPLWISQDTVRVRSRWETAGVDIRFGP